jgi:hypothetical protein
VDHHQSSLFNSLIISFWILIAALLIPSAVHATIESIQWGPEVGVSFPQPLQIGAQISCSGTGLFCHSRWKYYVDTGFFPVSLSSDSRKLEIFSIETGARITPFSFPLTFSLGLGYRTINFSTRDVSAFLLDGATVASNASLIFSTLYFNPGIGWEFNLSEQLTLAIQIGMQFALIGNGSLFLSNQSTGANSGNSSLLETDSGAPLRRVASLVVPSLTLMRLTWRFD